MENSLHIRSGAGPQKSVWIDELVAKSRRRAPPNICFAGFVLPSSTSSSPSIWFADFVFSWLNEVVAEPRRRVFLIVLKISPRSWLMNSTPWRAFSHPVGEVSLGVPSGHWGPSGTTGIDLKLKQKVCANSFGKSSKFQTIFEKHIQKQNTIKKQSIWYKISETNHYKLFIEINIDLNIIWTI